MKRVLAAAMVVFLALAIAPVLASSSGFSGGSSVTRGRTANVTNSCQTILTRAMDTLQSTCQRVGRNKACYGNVKVQADPIPDAQLKFSAIGDIANLSDIRTL